MYDSLATVLANQGLTLPNHWQQTMRDSKAHSIKTRPIVLVTEDDPVFRRVIAFSLMAAGFECLTASHGQAALDILDQTAVDVLVTDHQMPVCSGLELIQKIRLNDALRRLPIILCTAKSFELDAADLTKTFNLLAVLRKPFSPRQMISLISSYLDFQPTLTNAGHTQSHS